MVQVSTLTPGPTTGLPITTSSSTSTTSRATTTQQVVTSTAPTTVNPTTESQRPPDTSRPIDVSTQMPTRPFTKPEEVTKTPSSSNGNLYTI